MALKPDNSESGSMSNPLSLPPLKFTGGRGGDALAGRSQASSSGAITGNFSVGGSSATETLTSAFSTNATSILMIGGAVFLGVILIRRLL